jgi:anthranilate synthase/aminodeoxychorismate synthase-like glutamine amidotransferase
MLLLIDNYDSFTYNLYQYLGELGAEVEVVRNDQMTVEDIDEMAPDRIIISPGPGNPDDASISKDVIRRFAERLPILGVCLGHQCIGEVFGGVVEGAGEILHGKVSRITHDGRGVFAGIPSPLEATRYHSLAIRPDSMPATLEVSARSDSGVIMGVRHRYLPVEGVQFHPESILTPDGHTILRNFLAL